jgi:hypothetical protein
MTHLFKYVTPATGRKIIENGTLRWSTPQMLNDLFDMQFAYQLRLDRQAALNAFWRLTHVTREEFGQDREIGAGIDAMIDDMKKLIPEISENILSHFINDKIFCLSDIPDSVLMWSHYAQNHTGIVLRFTDQTPGNPFVRAQRVRYVDQMPSLFDEKVLSIMLSGNRGLDTRHIMDEIIYTKSSHWAHEREWRIYAGSGRGGDSYEDVSFNAKELDGVIFGVRTPKPNGGFSQTCSRFAIHTSSYCRRRQRMMHSAWMSDRRPSCHTIFLG